jgi:hypothetical protein
MMIIKNLLNCLNSSIFWDKTWNSLFKVTFWHFGGTCHFHFQGESINQEKNRMKQAASFALTLKMERTFHNHHCENLKSYKLAEGWLFVTVRQHIQ